MNVLITRKIPEKAIKLLEAAGHRCTVLNETTSLSQEQLINQCQMHDALLSVGSNQLNHHFFGVCKHLKAIALLSAGYENVDIDAANLFEIPISNIRDVLSNATADIALLLMLAVSRNAFNMHKSIERGEWKTRAFTANLGIELYGKTLGILGLGSIGMELARKAKAIYQMNIVYHNRTKNPIAEAVVGAQYVSHEHLLQQSDVLSVHAGLSSETQGLFDLTAFQKMKPSSIFINTARGGIHKENDLIYALQTGIIWGAGLDVTHPEPMNRNNPLLNLPNVCVLPHLGSATTETREKMAMMAAQNIIEALNGKRMPQLINSIIP